MELQQLITLAFQLSILAAAFGCGLGATTTDARDLMRRPELLGRSLLAMFVIVPIAAVVLLHAFQVPHAAFRLTLSAFMLLRTGANKGYYAKLKSSA